MTTFSKIITKLELERAISLAEFNKILMEASSVSELLNKWFVDKLIPKSSKNKNWTSLEELRTYLSKRKNLALTNELNKEISRVNLISNSSKEISEILIEIQWKKSSWGLNPTAWTKIYYTDNSMNTFKSGSIGGCGYDKKSTAISEALNQCNELMKLLYTIREENIDEKNISNIIGYGSGYGLLPYFEGGVGFDCTERILKKFGFKCKQVSNMDKFQVYLLTKTS
jgi:hypothetical protein